jgi:Tir chaperone protein (CesT) family
MVTDLFGSLLQELSRTLGVSKLEPDSNNSCLLKLKSGLVIQIELDKSGQALIIGADLGPVPPGKYRENLFREALKANDQPHPLHGILCYSKKSDHLVLYQKINIKDLTGEKIAAEITPFAEKGFMWSEALLRNDIPSVNQPYSGQKPGGVFGLMR